MKNVKCKIGGCDGVVSNILHSSFFILTSTLHSSLVPRPTNLQIELRRDGRIIQRTDDCTTVFTSCYPFDWDGDGLENSVDPEPTVAGPDAHGTNAEWYRVVCSNVVEEIGNADWAWRTGVDSNAYRFVDFAVAQGPAPVYFTADGASRLGNPAVVALAGTVCRVPLLVGATYSVSSDVPFSVSAPMTDSVEIKTTGALSYSVYSPLRFEERTVVLDGHSAREFVPEPFLVGSFGWDLTLGGGTSCGCGAFSNCVWFACTNGCGCGGCRAEGTFAYEGYRVSVQDVSCGCGAGVMPDPLVPSFGISFSKSGVIFEDDYACSATSNVARRSTEVTVGVTASGGSNGGWLYLTRQDNIDRLVCKHGGAPSFPPARHLEPYETYSIAYTCTGRKESAYENDVELDGCFIEDGNGVRIDDYARLTVIRVDLTTGKDAPLNNKLHRHEYGIGEKIYVRHYPVPPGLSIIANDAKISGIPGLQTLEWGVSNVLHQMRIELPGVVYHPLIQVLVPSEIEGGIYVNDQPVDQ